MKLEKLTLLRPNMGNYRSLDAFPPLAMGILAARTPKDVQVVFHDDRVEEVPLDTPTDLVAISVETFTARRAYQLADAYRTRKIPVVMGGHHPTLMPEEAARHADIVVTGDAEGVWEELLEDFKHGATKPLYHGDVDRPLAPYRIDRSIFEGKKYAPADLIQYGRGCRHCCDFCSIHAFYGDTLKQHAAEEIAQDIKRMRAHSGRRLLMFVDDNLYASSQKLSELLQTIAPLNRRWACQISADVVNDQRILNQMAESGCRIVLIGFESLNENNLSAMKKGWNRSQGDYLDIVREFHDRGIAVCGTFVFGYDNDSRDTIEETVEFVKKARLEMAQLNPLTPLPTTPFYERLKREGRLLRPEWWIDPAYRYGDPILTPPGMDADEFAGLCFEAKKRFYSWNAMLRRIFLPASGLDLWNMSVFALVNLISRREVYRKQFRTVGV